MRCEAFFFARVGISLGVFVTCGLASYFIITMTMLYEVLKVR